MKHILVFSIVILTLFSCENQQQSNSSVDEVNWDKRKAILPLGDSLQSGTTYLSIYSHIYSETEHKVHDLTVTVGMRNTSREDTLYIENAEYYDTSGKLIRTYFNKPIFIAPMETVEIVIDQVDRSGGSGANFMFDWKTQSGANDPVFEAVMISTYSTQGISFTTQGIRVK